MVERANNDGLDDTDGPSPTVAGDTTARSGDGERGVPVGDEILPRTFGRFELRALLGRGGMGAVYLAYDPQLDRLVALKIPHTLGGEVGVWRDRFQSEARAAATLNHPNICPVFEVGEVGSELYLTMPYLEGETLEARNGRTGPLPIPEALELVRTLAEAIAEAHERGIVHRDLKPANVMIDRRGRPVVMDFGLALRTSASDDLRLTLSGVAMGTPSYMPPEQAGGDHGAVGPPADVYALGVILYELVTGRVPFQGKSFGKLLAQIERDPPRPPSELNPAVDPALEGLILRALEKAPEDRFATSGDLADALVRCPRGDRESVDSCCDPALKPTGIHISDEGRARSSGERAKRGRSWWARVAVGVLSLGLLALLGVTLYVATDYGDLVVELSDPGANVAVKVNGQVVTLDPEGDPIHVRAGANQMLEVSGRGFETTSERFDLKRGGRSVVRVRLRPKGEVAGVASGELESRPTPKLVEVPKQATLVEIPGWQILADASEEEMRHWLDARKKDEDSVTWLDVVQVGDEPVFCAVAALDDREDDWVAILDLTATELNDLKLLSKRLELQDRQIASLSGFARDRTVMSAALFRPGQRLGGALGITTLSVAKLNLVNFGREGQDARLIRPFPVGDGQLLSAVYLELALGKRVPYGLELTADELADQLERCRSKGLRPVSVVPYKADDERRFAVTYLENSPRRVWEVHRDLTAADLRRKSSELASAGLTPASVIAYPWDGAVRYSVVWVGESPEGD